MLIKQKAIRKSVGGNKEVYQQIEQYQKNKKVKLAQPQQFLAQDRAMVDIAYPGDIIGIHDPGIFNIGDTLCSNNQKLYYEGIPQFAPEHFMRVSTLNALKRKQFMKGILQLAEEGSIQVFRPHLTGTEELIVGVVGVLQFEVLEYRLKNEYGVEVKMQRLPYRFIRWIEAGDDFSFSGFKGSMDSTLVETPEGEPVLLCEFEWSIRQIQERNPDVVLRETHLKPAE